MDNYTLELLELNLEYRQGVRNKEFLNIEIAEGVFHGNGAIINR